MLVQHRLLPLEGCKPTMMQEYIQELPRKQTRTGRELPVIELPLEERTASWKRFERTTHGQANPEKWDREDPGDTPELPKPRKLEPERHRGGHVKSERCRADEARKRENEAKMSEMSREGTPPWVHDRYAICSI